VADAIVRTVELQKDYGKLHVLKGISLEIARGEVVCIIGPSGSGKSTLLRCMAFLEVPTAGRIYLNGELLGMRESLDGRLVLDRERNLLRIGLAPNPTRGSVRMLSFVTALGDPV
jgi:polar amino acid transport system ATP-binding protein